MASAQFAVNNKVYIATKVLPFMTNYRRELKIGDDIRRKGKVEKAMEFVGEDEVSTREGRGSTKESTRGHEEAGRQGKKKEQKLEKKR